MFKENPTLNEEILNLFRQNPDNPNWKYSFRSERDVHMNIVNDVIMQLQLQGFKAIYNKGYYHWHDSETPSITIQRDTSPICGEGEFAQWLTSERKDKSTLLKDKIITALSHKPQANSWRILFNNYKFYDMVVINNMLQQLSTEGFKTNYDPGYPHQLDNQEPSIYIERTPSTPSQGIFAQHLQPIPVEKSSLEIASEFSPMYLTFYRNANDSDIMDLFTHFDNFKGNIWRLAHMKKGYRLEIKGEHTHKIYIVPHVIQPQTNACLTDVILKDNEILLTPQTEEQLFPETDDKQKFKQWILYRCEQLKALYELLKTNDIKICEENSTLKKSTGSNITSFFNEAIPVPSAPPLPLYELNAIKESSAPPAPPY